MPGFDRFKNVDEERMRVGFSNEPGPDSGVKLSFQRNQNTPALFGASLWHGGPTFASVSGAAGQGRWSSKRIARTMKPRISMITLGVRDLAAATNFYEKGLGFPRMDSPPEVAFFTLNGTWLGLYGREALAEDAQVTAEGSGFEGFR